MLLQPDRVDRFGRREGRETPEPGFPPIEGTCEDEDRAEKEKKEAALLRAARPEANSGWLRAARVLSSARTTTVAPGASGPRWSPEGTGVRAFHTGSSEMSSVKASIRPDRSGKAKSWSRTYVPPSLRRIPDSS